jgi:hypothetical protein
VVATVDGPAGAALAATLFARLRAAGGWTEEAGDSRVQFQTLHCLPLAAAADDPLAAETPLQAAANQVSACMSVSLS